MRRTLASASRVRDAAPEGSQAVASDDSFPSSAPRRGPRLLAVVAALVLVGIPGPSDAALVYCRSGNPMTGVHDPSRLIVLSPCTRAAGTVSKVYIEHDGDYHISMTGVRSSLLNSKNKGTMVVERVPMFPLALPKVGSQITVTGPWVTDKSTGWNEIHPVWHITVQSGGTIAGTSGATEGNPGRVAPDPSPVDEADEQQVDAGN